MTTRSAKLYQGEDKSPVHDYTDLVVWEESEFGTRAWQGEGSASSIVIRDPQGEQGNELLLPAGLSRKSLAAKNLFVVEVDSSTLFRGRVGIKNYSRDNQHVERYRQVECSLHDTNWDLDHIFVHQYVRPSESDQARVQGLIASYLSTSPRATTALNGSNYISGSNLVTLPAQTYNRTSPLGVMREVSRTANKQFFVTGDAIGGGSLFYDGNDSTAYACTFTISDREDEVRSAVAPTFPPIWNVGPASTEDGSQLLSHVRLFYGTAEDQYVTASSATVQSQYSHASETITDDTAVSASDATIKAASLLAHRKYEDKNYNVTIGPLTDAQVVLVKHGMTIGIKARAIPDADDQVRTMRIVQCRYTTPVIGAWFAHLQLGRPWKMQPYGSGPVLTPQPSSAAGVPPVVVSSDSIQGFGGDAHWLAAFVAAETNTALYVAYVGDTAEPTGATWYPNWVNSGTPGAGGQALTQILTLTVGAATVRWYRLLSPTPSGTSTSKVELSTGLGAGTVANLWFLRDVHQTTPETTTATNSGTGTGSTLALAQGSSNRSLNIAGWVETNSTNSVPVAGGSQTSRMARMLERSFGLPDTSGGAGDGAANPTWGFTNSHAWVSGGVEVTTLTPGSTTEPTGSTGTGTVGTGDGTYVGPAHVHEHGNLTTGGPYHMAEDVTFAPTGTIAATDVQAAIAEVASEAGLSNYFLPESYGAIGDDTADDTTALQNCLNAIDTANGGTMLLSAKYKITAELNWDGSGLQVIGLGTRYAGAMIRQATANLGVFNFNTIVTSAQQSGQPPLLRDIVLRGSGYDDVGLNATSTAGDGIYALADVLLDNVGIEGFYNGVNLGTDSWYSRISGCFLYQNRNAGILAESVNNVTIDGCRIGFNGYGVTARDVTGLRITNCSVEQSEFDNVFIDGVTAGDLTTTAVYIAGCYFEGNLSASTAADVRVGSGFNVHNVTISGCNFTNISTYTSLILDRAQHVVLLNNDFWQNSTGAAISSTANTGKVVIVGGRREGTVSLPAGTIDLDPDHVRATPLPNGNAAPGTSAYPAFEDHVHTGGSTTAASDHAHVTDEQFSGDGVSTVFTLANEAELESAIAYVAGARTSVTVSGPINDQITFTAAPASGTDNISVDYVAVTT